MTDETETAGTDTREGKRARHFKAAIGDLLEELVETMEDARKEGFTTSFSVGNTPEGAYTVAVLKITKEW